MSLMMITDIKEHIISNRSKVHYTKIKNGGDIFMILLEKKFIMS